MTKHILPSVPEHAEPFGLCLDPSEELRTLAESAALLAHALNRAPDEPMTVSARRGASHLAEHLENRLRLYADAVEKESV